MRNLCDAASMSCEVADLPFQVHANYGTWSIDFESSMGCSFNAHIYHWFSGRKGQIFIAITKEILHFRNINEYKDSPIG